MGFLDNSGDIILDAVLTDTGRFRLAQGDGSFKIAKFALGDDEINYAEYNKNNASGSAYYDLNIMQTPVLEAFTNNASSAKSKLLSLGRNNLLFLPVIKLNEESTTTMRAIHSNAFLVAVDQDTETQIQTDLGENGGWMSGIISGQSLSKANYIRCEQGLDTTEIPDTVALDSDLVETQYIVEMDNRFGKIASATNPGQIANSSYVDDDNIASYYFSLTTNTGYVIDTWPGKINANKPVTNILYRGIHGPKGTRLKFMIASSIDLATSTYLFDTLGGSGFTLAIGGDGVYRFIDSNIRVIGGTTGYSMDIPIRYIKKQ